MINTRKSFNELRCSVKKTRPPGANRANQNVNLSNYFGKNEKTRSIEPLELTSRMPTTKKLRLTALNGPHLDAEAKTVRVMNK